MIVIPLVMISSSVAVGNVGTRISNSSPPTTSIGNWSAFAALTSTSSPTGVAYGPITLSHTTGCIPFSLPTTGTFGGPGNKKVNIDTTNLVNALLVFGSGIIQSGTNTIASRNATSITLAAGPNTSPTGTMLTFQSIKCFDQFFSIRNNGHSTLVKIGFTSTSTSSGGKSISLQSCDSGAVGSPAGSWTEATATCSGTTHTIMDTIGSGAGANSPQVIPGYSLPIPLGQSIRIRAVTTQGNAKVTTSIQVSSVGTNAGLLNASTNG